MVLAQLFTFPVQSCGQFIAFPVDDKSQDFVSAVKTCGVEFQVLSHNSPGVDVCFRTRTNV